MSEAILIKVLLAISGLLIVISMIPPLARRLLVADSVLLALVGILIGSGASYLLTTTLTDIFDPIAVTLVNFPISSRAFLFIFLPALVFHGALSIDVRRLARDTAPVLVMAVVAVFVTTATVGFALYPVSGLSLIVCLLLGSIIATTDPSAVVGVFRNIGAKPRLSRLVEGESLLNDAAAIALFTILFDRLTQNTEAAIGVAVERFVESFLGGLAVGYALARMALAAMPFLGGIRVAEVTLTVALPYFAYIVCDEYLHFSGVVAAAAAGLAFGALGPTVLRPANWNYLVDVWAQVSFIAGSLVFVLASMLAPRLLVGVSSADLFLLAIVIGAALLGGIL